MLLVFHSLSVTVGSGCPSECVRVNIRWLCLWLFLSLALVKSVSGDIVWGGKMDKSGEQSSKYRA